MISIALICLAFLAVAFLYASVGHGGASGYLAVLSLFSLATKEMSSTALIDRKSTRLNSSHIQKSRMPSSA